ncbi:MAG: hypothetical protein BJ554DRAFT_3121 [Olpidium bornovanus]|uniref:Protein-serine/threonine kinase n=1 Tax=Olpidium bornovanus TaxID=278681 RepID=A0A8H8DGE8_9FUNG|nr:MAG: hypothetical protein BJ554DRAFT_3121 [Olpidium bornovanus]
MARTASAALCRFARPAAAPLGHLRHPVSREQLAPSLAPDPGPPVRRSPSAFHSCAVERHSCLSPLPPRKRLRQEAEICWQPRLRFHRSSAAGQSASEGLLSQLPSPAQSNRRRTYEQNAHFYQNRILDPYLARPVQKVTLRQLVVFGRNMTDEQLLRGANYVRTELPVRLAHRIRDFQSLPFIVGTNVERVYNLYWSAFEILRKIPEIHTLEQNKSFCRILNRLLDQHLSVVPQLTLGITECAASGLLNNRHADSFMNGVLRSRVSRRVIAEHHIQLTGQRTSWWVGDDAKEGTTTTLCRGTRKWDGISCRDGTPTDEWAARAAGAGLVGPPTQWEARTQTQIDKDGVPELASSGFPRGGDLTLSEIPRTVDSQLTGIVQTNIHAGVTVLKCVKVTGDSIREAYGIEPPRINLDGHTSAVFTYIPGHIEFILFELLKNSMRSTIQKHHCDSREVPPPVNGDDAALECPAAGSPPVARAINRLPPIRITICQGEQDIIFRVSDQGGGIPREIYDNLWSFSHITTSNSRHPAAAAASPSSTASSVDHWPADSSGPLQTPRFLATVRETIPQYNLGIGLNMSRVYANYWGGDLSVYSVWGYGTDAYVRISRLGNQVENLEFEER